MLHRSITALALLAMLCVAQEPAPNRILRPVDGAVFPSGKIEAIAKLVTKGELRLDGKPLAAQQKAPGVITHMITAPEGPHVLELLFDGGNEKIRFFIGTAPTGPDWKAFRLHPPAATCETCHAIKENVWDFKNDKLETTCAGCHNLKTFAANHQHNTTQLADCAMCHNPHGSTTQFHMKYPRAVACKQCHG